MSGRGGRRRLDRRPAPAAAMVWTALVLALATLATAGFAPAARAHAVLLETVPTDGAILADSPDEILLRFNEPVRPIAVQVLDRSGRTVAAPEHIHAADGTLRIALPAPLPDGGYVVSYRVASADAHPVAGAFLFTVGSAGQTPADARAIGETPDRSGAGWWWAVALIRVVRDAALLAAAGGAMALLFVAGGTDPSVRNRIRRGLLAAAGLGIGAAAVGPGLQGGLLAGLPAHAILEPDPWRIGWTSSAGPSAVVTIAGLALLATGLRMRPGAVRLLAVAIGLTAATGGLLLSGHAAATDPRWLTAPAWALHLLAAAFWAGALWPLLVVLRAEQPATAARVLRRFSRLAVAAVGGLVTAGLAIATVQTGTVTALFGTGYGRLLLAKLGLVAGLLLIAANNKWRLTPALAAGDAGAALQLRRAIRAEIGVVVAILAVTAVLAQTPPPAAEDTGGHASHHRSHDHEGAAGRAVTARADGIMARLEVTPGTAGPNAVTIALTTADGDPVRPLELSVAFSQPAIGIAPIKRAPAAVGPGRYRLEAFEFLVPGRWTVRVEALITDFEKAVLTAEVPIQ